MKALGKTPEMDTVWIFYEGFVSVLWKTKLCFILQNTKQSSPNNSGYWNWHCTLTYPLQIGDNTTCSENISSSFFKLFSETHFIMMSLLKAWLPQMFFFLSMIGWQHQVAPLNFAPNLNHLSPFVFYLAGAEKNPKTNLIEWVWCACMLGYCSLWIVQAYHNDWVRCIVRKCGMQCGNIKMG